MPPTNDRRINTGCAGDKKQTLRVRSSQLRYIYALVLLPNGNVDALRSSQPQVGVSQNHTRAGDRSGTPLQSRLGIAFFRLFRFGSMLPTPPRAPGWVFNDDTSTAPSADPHERRLYLLQKNKRTPRVIDRVLALPLPFSFKSRPRPSSSSCSSSCSSSDFLTLTEPPRPRPETIPHPSAPTTRVVPALRVTSWGRHNGGEPLLPFRPPFLRGLR